MRDTTRVGTGGPRRWLWPAISVLIVTGAVLVAVGLAGRGSSLPGPTASSATSTAAPARSPTRAASTLVVASPSVPTRLVIDRLGLSVALGTLGMNADGTVQVPTTADQAGWFRLGPTPGAVGSAVILGHVDSWRGPGVFFGLRSLAPGDDVDVSLASGVVAHFSVTAVTTYPKQSFPAQQVYASHGVSALQLVTCGGVFDSATGSYLSNVVVYSTLVGTTPASASTRVATGP